jgi:hypothetical protein
MRRRGDAVFVALAAAHGVALLSAPTVPLIAAGVWWNSNTIAHNFVHRRFFRVAWANMAFSVLQSVMLGIPQTIWRQRHLAHHANRPWRPVWTLTLVVELSLIAALWTVMAIASPTFFLGVYCPGYLIGLGLCAMQGHFEHARGTTSHYGRIYNALCFNDGYHREHHAFPGVHWSELPRIRAERSDTAQVSRWPPLLRWLDGHPLDYLERLVLGSGRLQRFVVDAHARALCALIAGEPISNVAIVGGGLFPRTALVIQRVVPAARIVIIDSDAEHLKLARTFLVGMGQSADTLPEFRHQTFVPSEAREEFDLVIVPLAFRGDRLQLYREPPALRVLVHDWAWRPRGTTRLVSWLLLKRVNLITR